MATLNVGQFYIVVSEEKALALQTSWKDFSLIKGRYLRMGTENILVAVRMRPLISREIEKNEIFWRAEPPTSICQINTSEKPLAFNFDRVFDGKVKNEEIYSEVCSDIVRSAIDGFNGTIFAYGQTSSGKTYTMLGDKGRNVKGIIHYAIEDLFSLIQDMPEREFLLRVSYMEIYNETVRDLFTGEDNLNLKIEHNQIKVVGLQEKLVQKPEQILKFMKEGESRRRTGDTKMNEKSSRSHAIFRMIIESCMRGVENAAVNVSQFNLIDLAGSERARNTGATGVRFKESININQSLLCLGQVIRQLSENPNQFISYRDSKLTRILQNSLGGNSLTAIICTVTAACLEETQSTLKFAERAKNIKNKPHINEVLTEQALLKQCVNKIKKLTAELEATKEEKSMQNKNLQEKIKYLEKQFVFQMNPDMIVKTNRRETWGGALDSARFRKLELASQKSFESRRSISRTHSGCGNLSILEEHCEDADADEFSFPLQSTQQLKLPKRSSTSKRSSHLLEKAEVAVQVGPGTLSPSIEFSESEREKMSKQIESLEKEMAELREFTTLERQIMSESNSCSDSCKVKNSIPANEDWSSHSKYPVSVFDSSVFEEKEQKNLVNENSVFLPSDSYKLKFSEMEEDLFQYIESTMKIMGMRKYIDFSSVSSDLNSNYKIILEMFNLILQYQCLAFKGCFKSEIHKKIDEVLCKLSNVFRSFNDHGTSNETIEDLIRKFMNETDYIMKEIEMCSLDSDDKNGIINESRPFDSITDLPSFGESPRTSLCSNEVENKTSSENDPNSHKDGNKENETSSVCDCENLKCKIFELEKDIEKHLDSISAANYSNNELKEKITALQKQIEIYETSNLNASNSLITFKDQACQFTYMEGVSLNSGLDESNKSVQDVNSILCCNCNGSFTENKLLIKEPEEVCEQDLPIIHSEKENCTDQLKTSFEETLTDLIELKVYTLEFMKRDMKKEYLEDINVFDDSGTYPLSDQMKIEMTALKEMLLCLEFYLNKRSNMEKYLTDSLENSSSFISALERKLARAESTIKVNAEEFEKLESSLLNIEGNLSQMVQKLKSIGSVKDKINYFELTNTSFILHSNKSLDCAVSIQKLISEMDTLIDQTILSMNDLSLKFEKQDKLIVLQNNNKETKSVQTVEDHVNLDDISQKLKETIALNEKLYGEIEKLKSELDISIEEKCTLQEELYRKIKFYDTKIEDMEMNFNLEKVVWANKRVEETEEKYYKMLMDQENKFSEEKHQNTLDFYQQIIDIKQDMKNQVDKLQEEHETKISDLKNRLDTEIEERFKEKMKLGEKIRTREKDIAQYQKYNSYLKSKCKELAVELMKHKEKAKSFEQKEKFLVDCKQTQTDDNDFEEKPNSTPDSCNQCKEFMQKVSNLEAIHQSEVKKSEVLYMKLQNELGAKKAKIISLESNNAKLVKEIQTLNKEVSTKAMLLRFCECRGLTNKTGEAQNLKKFESTEKGKDMNQEKNSDLREGNSQDILQLEIVQDAIKKARSEERQSLLNGAGSGAASSINSYYLQVKLNKNIQELEKKNKEINLLKTELIELSKKPSKQCFEVLKEPLKDVEENNFTPFSKPDNPLVEGDVLQLKMQRKKVLKEANRKLIAPFSITKEEKQKDKVDVENVNPFSRPIYHEAVTNSKSPDTGEDKAVKTQRQINMLFGAAHWPWE